MSQFLRISIDSVDNPIYDLREFESTKSTMPGSDNTQDARKKKAIWRAEHRGIREMDLLMGSFARRHVSSMDEASLQEFEALIDVADLDLYNWLLELVETPAEYRTAILSQLKQHQFDQPDYD